MTDVIAEIIQGTPRRVSSFNSSVPEDMDRIIAKCLEKDRDERYQTAADLLADLKRPGRDGAIQLMKWRRQTEEIKQRRFWSRGRPNAQSLQLKRRNGRFYW